MSSHFYEGYLEPVTQVVELEEPCVNINPRNQRQAENGQGGMNNYLYNVHFVTIRGKEISQVQLDLMESKTYFDSID